MKKDKEIKVGLEFLDQGIIDLIHLDSTIPNNLNDIIKNFTSLVSKIKTLNSPNNIHYKADEVRILAPIPVPVRDIICVGKNALLNMQKKSKGHHLIHYKVNKLFQQNQLFLIKHNLSNWSK